MLDAAPGGGTAFLFHLLLEMHASIRRLWSSAAVFLLGNGSKFVMDDWVQVPDSGCVVLQRDSPCCLDGLSPLYMGTKF